MKKSELTELIKEEIKNILSEESLKFEEGYLVTIPKNLTTDPYNMQGKKGTIVYMNDNDVVVEFDKGKLGIYSKGVFSVDEVSDEKIEKTKEYNQELEKTKDLMKDLTDK